MKHYLKTLPQYFQAVIDGRKFFELRYNDRKFKVGDTVILKEYNDCFGIYTNRTCKVTIEDIFYLDDIGFKNCVIFTFCGVLYFEPNTD